jgi:hypothetical protein
MPSTQRTPRLPQDYELLVATPIAIRGLLLVLITLQFVGLTYMLTDVFASSPHVQYLILAVILLLYLHFVRNTLDVTNWVSGAIAGDGVYLPVKRGGEFVLLPWQSIGSIEIGRAGLLVYGLRLRLLDERLAEQLANAVHNRRDGWLLRLPTQMMDRARLLQRIEALRQKA